MISLLIVNYRSAALAADAIRSARAGTSAPLQVVVVDNSCDPAEAAALRPVADVLIEAERNLGYAGGINLGRKSCSAPVIVVSNPDVSFSTNALDALASVLDERTAVAGPALAWDDSHEWHLPPADLNSLGEKIDEVLASRLRSWMRWRDRRRFRKRVAFWSLNEITEVRVLSGAVMAIRADDFDALGGFDERFELYFEEIDFLRRIAERHKRIVYVPAAQCRHAYNQSARLDADRANTSYAQSEMKYLEKWCGPFAARLLKSFEHAPQPLPAKIVEGPIPIDSENLVVEVSPLPSFATAAGHFPRSREVRLPPEVLRSAGSTKLFVRTLERP